MKKLKIFNTINSKIEEFQPIENDVVKLYSCGLTVYDHAHIGHARTTIFVDILVRLLRVLYNKVIYIRNITDVDDKINIKAKEKNTNIYNLTKEIVESCNLSMSYINNIKPDYEPRVTENIKDIIEFIQKIIDNGHAYVSNGHVFFDVSSYKDYGKLSHINIDNLLNGVRIDNEINKKNPLDFVLWKPSLDIDDESSKFNSPWGIGRPGWHIECSAMSHKYLGENFDIHCGGMDLKFPHHENEIAQSCCAFKNSNFAKFWFHVGFLMVNGEKMSKSLGNYILINSIQEKSISGKVLRLTMLKNQYGKPLDFSYKLITEAKNNLENLHKKIIDTETNSNVPEELIDVLCDNLNTPKVVNLLNEFNKKKEYIKLKSSLVFLGLFDERVFDKKIFKLKIEKTEINKLIKIRSEAKKNRDWEKSDKIRNQLKELGIELIDTKEGTIWKPIE